MRKRKDLYPCAEDVRKGRYTKNVRNHITEEEPDFIGNAPNYDKFVGWDTEKVLVWLNID